MIYLMIWCLSHTEDQPKWIAREMRLPSTRSFTPAICGLFTPKVEVSGKEGKINYPFLLPHTPLLDNNFLLELFLTIIFLDFVNLSRFL